MGAVVRTHRHADGSKKSSTGRGSCIHRLPAESWFPLRQISQNIPHQGLGSRIAFGSACHVELAEEHYAFAFLVFNQRAVLKTETAVENRQEIAARGFLDQHGGYIPAITAAPHSRYGNARPLDG